MVFGHGFGLELAQRPFETTFSSRNAFRSPPHLQGGPKPPLIDWPLFPAHKGRECAELEERGPVHLVGTNQGSVDWVSPWAPGFRVGTKTAHFSNLARTKKPCSFTPDCCNSGVNPNQQTTWLTKTL